MTVMLVATVSAWIKTVLALDAKQSGTDFVSLSRWCALGMKSVNKKKKII